MRRLLVGWPSRCATVTIVPLVAALAALAAIAPAGAQPRTSGSPIFPG